MSWINWNLNESQRDLLEFTRLLIRLFHKHPVFRRRHFFQGRQILGSEVKDLTWFRPDGNEMSEADWSNPTGRCLGLRLSGDAIEEMDERGNRTVDDTFLWLLNADHSPISFVLPACRKTVKWRLVFDTREMPGKEVTIPGFGLYQMEPLSTALFQRKSLIRRQKTPRISESPDLY